MERKPDSVGTIITMALFALIVLQVMMVALHASTVTIGYSDFQRLVAARAVDDLEIGSTQIEGTVKMPAAAKILSASDAAALDKQTPPRRFTTTRVADDRLVEVARHQAHRLPLNGRQVTAGDTLPP